MYEYQQPDLKGHFGVYGGSFVSETLTHALTELKEAYAKYQYEPEFLKEFQYELAHFVGRPSPIYHAARMSREQGGAQIYLKREDLNHTGAHKINNTIGQAMLAKRMGKPRVIAETGAGQHGDRGDQRRRDCAAGEQPGKRRSAAPLSSGERSGDEKQRRIERVMHVGICRTCRSGAIQCRAPALVQLPRRDRSGP